MANIPQSWFDEEHDELRKMLIDIMTGQAEPPSNPDSTPIASSPSHSKGQDIASGYSEAAPQGFELELMIAFNTTIQSKSKIKRAARKIKSMDDLYELFAKHSES